MAQQHKACTKCGEVKPLDGFYKSKLGKHGVRGRCKPCELKCQRHYRESVQYRRAESDRRYRENYRVINNFKNRKRHRKEQELTKTFVTVPHGTPYLPGEDALILADNGMTNYQKAIELGRTRESVQDRRKRLLRKLNA